MGYRVTNRSAVISDCDLFRYRLEREFPWEGKVAAVLMVNPSKADAKTDDHTIRKWYGFSARLGFRRFIVGNMFAGRATNVHDLRNMIDPIGPENDRHIEQILRDADIHIVAWGARAKLPADLRGRWGDVVRIAEKVGCPLHCFGVGKDGHPKHPLMLAYDTPLQPWTWPRAA